MTPVAAYYIFLALENERGCQKTAHGTAPVDARARPLLDRRSRA